MDAEKERLQVEARGDINPGKAPTDDPRPRGLANTRNTDFGTVRGYDDISNGKLREV